jgi:phosphohistidine phosphatase SixA
MKLRHLLAIAVGFCLSPFTLATDLSAKLQSSDHVLLMRHTLAPGVGDPAHYNLQECQTQRNLSPEGRQHALQTGKWLRQQGVHQASVFSSAWCRCKDTAQGLQFNAYTIEPALASFFDDMHLAQERTRALERFIAAQLPTKGQRALILVTHHVNIFDYMGENIDSGDMVLAKVNASGKMLSYQVIPRPLGESISPK